MESDADIKSSYSVTLLKVHFILTKFSVFLFSCIYLLFMALPLSLYCEHKIYWLYSYKGGCDVVVLKGTNNRRFDYSIKN